MLEWGASGTPLRTDDVVSVVSSCAVQGTASARSVQEGMFRGRDPGAAASTHHDGVVDVGDDAEMLVIRHDARRTTGRPALDTALAGRSHIAEAGAGSGVAVRKGGCSLAAVSSGQAERADVARDAGPEWSRRAIRFEALAQNRHVDESAAVREASRRVADRDEHGLAGDYALKNDAICAGSAARKPVVAARHEILTEIRALRSKPIPPESDARVIQPATWRRPAEMTRIHTPAVSARASEGDSS